MPPTIISRISVVRPLAVICSTSVAELVRKSYAPATAMLVPVELFVIEATRALFAPNAFLPAALTSAASLTTTGEVTAPLAELLDGDGLKWGPEE
jgi:fructose-specific component phosphotransferase system IIB-like protein